MNGTIGNATLKATLSICIAAACIAALEKTIALAQENDGPAFEDRESMVRIFDTRTREAVAAVETVCTQRQLDEIATALVPQPDSDERRVILESAKRRLREAGLSEDDPLVQSVTQRIDALPRPEAPGGVP